MQIILRYLFELLNKVKLRGEPASNSSKNNININIFVAKGSLPT